MNDYLAAAILGFLQGATEFLPVSSSGHLVLAQHLIPGWEEPGVLFDILLHVATLASILLAYRRETATLVKGVLTGDRREWSFFLALIVGSVPTAAIGLGFQEKFEAWFTSPGAVGGFLLVTAVLLVIAKRRWWFADVGHVSLKDAVIIGTFQGMAIAPGISRSGATFAGGLLRGVDPALAARFSFFLSIPAILGATLLKFSDVSVLPPLGPVLVGMAVAAVTGVIAIRLFIGTLVRGRMLRFAAYCFIVGCLAIRYFGGAI